MARGPVEKINSTSDIYLLGAILYEIISGKPPHSGRDVMQCLMTAAQNTIDGIRYEGELKSIALQAMATKQDDRYASVKDFQEAIRTYQAHSESLVLTAHANLNLQKARESGDYQLFARALYGFQESLNLWSANDRARVLLAETQLDYAKCALDKGDFDLGASLLGRAQPEAGRAAGQDQRRPGRARPAPTPAPPREAGGRGAARGGRHDHHDRARSSCNQQRTEAIVAEATIAVEAAGAKRCQKASASEIGEAKRMPPEGSIADRRGGKPGSRKASRRAEEQDAEAQEQEKIAVEQEKASPKKPRRRRNTRRTSPRSASPRPRSTRTPSTTRSNLLEPVHSRTCATGSGAGWCTSASWVPGTYQAAGPVDAVAYSPDGRQFASGDLGGQLIVRDVETGEEVFRAKHGQYVHAVAYSPDGKHLATGSSDHQIRIVNADDRRTREQRSRATPTAW